MFHIDKIANQLRKVGSPAEVRGIADSGWFIETGKVPEQGNFRNWQVNRRGSFSYHDDKLSWDLVPGPAYAGPILRFNCSGPCRYYDFSWSLKTACTSKCSYVICLHADFGGRGDFSDLVR